MVEADFGRDGWWGGGFSGGVRGCGVETPDSGVSTTTRTGRFFGGVLQGDEGGHLSEDWGRI